MKLSICNEDSKFSMRKLWSLTNIVVYLAYNGYVILYKQPADIPTNIALIMGSVVAFYFAKTSLRSIFNKDK